MVEPKSKRTHKSKHSTPETELKESQPELEIAAPAAQDLDDNGVQDTPAADAAAPVEKIQSDSQQADSEKGKRIRRNSQQLAEAIDAQIAKLESSIAQIEGKKQAAAVEYDGKIKALKDKIKAINDKKKAVLSEKPKSRKPRKTKKDKINDILKQAQKNGLKPEEIAEKLGISIKK